MSARDQDLGINYPQNNAWGDQEPLDGEAYVAFLTKEPFDDGREYLAVELMQPLMVGEEYYVSFFASNNDGGGTPTDCASNNIGLDLLVNPPYYWNTFGDEFSFSPTNTSLINHDAILMDSIGWTHIDGNFIADQPYTHLVIGNLYDDANTLFQLGEGASSCEAFYYIDYVCLAPSESQCDNPVSISEDNAHGGLKVYPNPASDFLNFLGPQNTEFSRIQLFDAFGNLVMESVPRSDTNIDISELSRGAYQLRIHTENEFYIHSVIIH